MCFKICEYSDVYSNEIKKYMLTGNNKLRTRWDITRCSSNEIFEKEEEKVLRIIRNELKEDFDKLVFGEEKDE